MPVNALLDITLAVPDPRRRRRRRRRDPGGAPVHEPLRGPRTGLTGALKALSKEVAPHNVTINQLLPGRFDTGRQESMAQPVMEVLRADGIS